MQKLEESCMEESGWYYCGVVRWGWGGVRSEVSMGASVPGSGLALRLCRHCGEPPKVGQCVRTGMLSISGASKRFLP